MVPRTGDISQEAYHTLHRLLTEGATGCLSGHAGPVVYYLYIMNGEMLAAHTAQDPRRIIELLRNGGNLSTTQANDMVRRVNAGENLADLLGSALPEEHVSRLFYERFRDNVFSFITIGQDISFEPMEAIFVENIQVNHDSKGILAELWQLQNLLLKARLDGSQQLVRAQNGDAPEESWFLELASQPRRIEELLRFSPWEWCRTLELILVLMEKGALVDPVMLAPSPEPVAAQPPTPSRPPEAAVPPPGAPDPIDEELAAFQDYDSDRSGGTFSADQSLLDKVNLDEGRVAPPPREAPRSIILDPIELGDLDPASKEQLKGLVSLNFAGRKLQESDIERKLDVVNEVLGIIVDAWNESSSGLGQTQLQLLIDGAPAAYAPLFKGLEPDPNGQLSLEMVLKNLKRRPPSEHRHLINQGFADLIQRALSLAGETLSEESMDHTLEGIAGYQQRFGL